MLKDITIGQYFPGQSIVHRLDPRYKIIITLTYIIMLFAAAKIPSLIPGVIFAVTALILSRIPFSLIGKSLKPIIPLIIFTTILNLFLYDGDPVIKIGFIEIAYDAIETSIMTIIRVIFLIAGTSLLTYTTSPIMLTDAIESLLAPLKKINFPVHDLAMMMTIALRFIPTIIEETDKIMNAQKARGANIETGSLAQRAKAMVTILIPLFVSAVKRAGELALAMECRCYRGDVGRTRMKQLKSGAKDYIAIILTMAFLALVFVLNFAFRNLELF
ncbi:MAG: energy-coupling factor transporter transmembrane protein EcfT [Oscillospiraceae bacterium]|nr:energy-coupling factor transporter transmembrane protein EcfT [Oscillospiraceae bacterium]